MTLFDYIFDFINGYIIPASVEFFGVGVCNALSAFIAVAFVLFCVVRPFWWLIKTSFSSNNPFGKVEK